MDRLRHRLRQRLALANDDQRGTTLAELLVGMAVMTVFMTIFTGAVISMARTTVTVQAVTGSSSQVNTAFLRLDKLVRYATSITDPAQAEGTGDWHVELGTIDPDTSAPTCTQLQIHDRALQLRTWEPASSTTYRTASLTRWRTLASRVENGAASAGSADQPFSVAAPEDGTSSLYQRLTIKVTAGGSGGSGSTTRGDMTFTALNSRAADAANSQQCQQLPIGTP